MCLLELPHHHRGWFIGLLVVVYFEFGVAGHHHSLRGVTGISLLGSLHHHHILDRYYRRGACLTPVWGRTRLTSPPPHDLFLFLVYFS